MRVWPRRSAWPGFVAAVMAVAMLSACEDSESDVMIAKPATSHWPWETSPPTSTPEPVAPKEAPTVVVTFTPAATEEPTATPEPTESPEPTATATPTAAPSPTSAPPAPDDPPDGSDGLATAVVELTNVERVRHGCPELRVDDRLTAAAQGHSEDMAERNYFSHESPEGEGPGERARAEGYPWWSGENIARGYRTAAAVVDGWMDSEGHRANILNCDSVAIGVGVADSSRGLYWTQKFGRR